MDFVHATGLWEQKHVHTHSEKALMKISFCKSSLVIWKKSTVKKIKKKLLLLYLTPDSFYTIC